MKKLLLVLGLWTVSGVHAQDKRLYDLPEPGLRTAEAGSAVCWYEGPLLQNAGSECSLLSGGYFTLATSNDLDSSRLDNNCSITFDHPYALTSYPLLTVDGKRYKPEELFDPAQLSLIRRGDTLQVTAVKAGDEFNIIRYNYQIRTWQSQPVAATGVNKNTARQFLKTISREYGSLLESGLNTVLQQITDRLFSNTILLISDGRADLDPGSVEASNMQRTAILPLAVGDDPDRSRLEMLAGLNYGFVTYLDEDTGIQTELLAVFRCISQPLLQDVAMEYGRADLYDILPAT